MYRGCLEASLIRLNCLFRVSTIYAGYPILFGHVQFLYIARSQPERITIRSVTMRLMNFADPVWVHFMVDAEQNGSAIALDVFGRFRKTVFGQSVHVDHD